MTKKEVIKKILEEAKITSSYHGEVEEVDGEFQPIGWCFDCMGNVPILSIVEGKVLTAGYTIEELIRIKDGNNILNNIIDDNDKEI